jgi:hypothetical protein
MVSVAYGDALTSLTDGDVGVVVPEAKHRYGPASAARHVTPGWVMTHRLRPGEAWER